MRERLDNISGKLEKKFGYRTGKKERQNMIGNLVQLVREHIELVNDITTLQEMLVFVRDEDGKPQALSGKHDDCVLSLSIAHVSRDQQTYELPKTQFRLPKDIEPDLAQDYWNAPADKRPYLLQKWGLLN
jgi:phage terminase large subunit